MKRIFYTIMTLSALALLLASCGKEPMPGKGSSPAIKLTVEGVYDTKASVITTSSLQEEAVFKLSAYVTKSWQRDSVGSSGKINPGIYVDPGQYSGAYDASTASPQTLKDVNVFYSTSYKDLHWRIEGNTDDDYVNPRFSWVNNVPINFFAYAPKTIKGSRSITKSDSSVDANYPFTYAALVSSDEVTSANCDDIIFAYTSHTASFEDDHENPGFGTLKDGTSDMFSLKFYHALAQIRFCVDPADFTDIKLVYVRLVGPASSSGSSGYLGLATSGSCTYAGAMNTFNWVSSTLGNRHAYRQTFGTSGVTFASGLPDSKWVASKYGTNPEKDLYTCTGDVLLVIPQTLENCGVEVGIQIGSGPVEILKGHLPATTNTSTNVSWDAGYYYTYKIGTVGEREDLSLSMTLVDWSEREHYIPID